MSVFVFFVRFEYLSFIQENMSLPKMLNESRDTIIILYNIYASPSSGDAYSDWQLTLSFELWAEKFLCADMFPYEDYEIVSVCQSICPYPEKRNLPSFVNISPIVELIHQWKGLHEYYSMKTHKFDFLFKICWNLILICSEKLPCIITSFFHASTFINFFLYIQW